MRYKDSNKKKKILHIVEAFGGGVFTVLSDLINNLSDDFDIVIAYGKRKQTPSNFKEYFNEKNVKFVEVKNFTRSINPKKDIKALKEIKNIIKKENPDIIHLHSSKAGILGRIAIRSKEIKMFYNPHGFSFLKQDDSKLKRMVYWVIEKTTAVINKKCTIIGCSKGEYLEAKKLNKNSICINNGIDLEKLKIETKDLEKHKIDYDNLKVCTIGRIGYQKNPELFNEIASNLPSLDFIWIGDGELKDRLVSSNIKVTGWISRKEVLKELNNQDVFILTSLWEGLPISLLEAMYMKKICIVSNCIGNKDVIKSGLNGFVCKDVKEYKEKIEKLKDCGEKIRKSAYKSVLETYNVEIMTKEYKKVYNNVYIKNKK